jgi:hypothetical protein
VKLTSEKAVQLAQEHVESSKNRILDALITDVRACLRKYPFLTEYVQAMGTFFFVLAFEGQSEQISLDKPEELERRWMWNELNEDSRQQYLEFGQTARELFKIHQNWHELFSDYCSSYPIRISRNGKVVTSWG